MPAPERRPSPLRSLRAAVAFLTRVPVDPRGTVEAADVAGGAIFFPVVGALVGGASAAVAWALALVLPAAVAALGAVAAGAALTGALHLDGLADTADSYGAHDRGRALAIMRDHAVGSYGVVAIVLDLALRAAATAALLTRPRGILALVAAGALSRAASAATGALLRPARADASLGSVLAGSSRALAAGAAVLGTAIAVLAMGLAGLAAAAAVALAALAWGGLCRRRLGGITGDTLGAASEGAEVLVLLVGAALMT